jgi:hypothetical protein
VPKVNQPTVDDLTMALGMESFEKRLAQSQLNKAVAEIDRLTKEVERLTKLCDAVEAGKPAFPPTPEGF